MRCDVIRDLLPLYLDEACTEDTKEEVEAHLKECAGCRSSLAEMETHSSKEETEENLIEKQTIEKEKSKLKNDVKSEVMKQTVGTDMLINILLLAALLTGLFKGVDFPGIGTGVALILIVLLIIWEFWETVFQFRLRKGRAPGVAEYISLMSILIKTAILVIGLIVGITVFHGVV